MDWDEKVFLTVLLNRELKYDPDFQRGRGMVVCCKSGWLK